MKLQLPKEELENNSNIVHQQPHGGERREQCPANLVHSFKNGQTSSFGEQKIYTYLFLYVSNTQSYIDRQMHGGLYVYLIIKNLILHLNYFLKRNSDTENIQMYRYFHFQGYNTLELLLPKPNLTCRTWTCFRFSSGIIFLLH